VSIKGWKESTIKLHKFHSAQQHIAENRAKRTLMRCGRRFGKTTMFEDLACLFSMDGQSHGIDHGLNVGWFSPKYKYMQGSFRRIRSCLKPIIARASITDGIIELDEDMGGIIRFWTLQDEDAGRGDFYHEIFIDEVSLVEKGMRDIWEQSIAPTLLDYDGNAWMAGTPKGVNPENFFYFAATNKDPAQGQLWSEFHAPTMANPNISTKALAEFKEQLPPLVFQQEILAEFVDWTGSAFFALDKMLIDGKPVEYPIFCTNILVIIDTAVKDKKASDATAAIYCAYVQLPEPQLIILDYELLKIEGASLIKWIPDVYARAEQLADQCKARNGKLVYIEDRSSGSVLLQQIRNNNDGSKAIPIPEEFVSLGKTERALAVSGSYYHEKLKISEYAYNKVINLNGITKNHLIAQIVGFRLGIDAGAASDDALDCTTYAMLLAFGKR
jgi:hypothetical protein